MTIEQEDKLMGGLATLLVFSAVYAGSVGLGYAAIKLTEPKDAESQFKDHRVGLIVGVGAALFFSGYYGKLKKK